MKTKKRDKSERAYSLGYKAGIRGKSACNCPYVIATIRGSWMGGWRDGRDDSRLGYLDLDYV